MDIKTNHRIEAFHAEIDPLLKQLQAKCEELDFDFFSIINVPLDNSGEGFTMTGRTCFNGARSPMFLAFERMMRAESVGEIMFHVLRARSMTSLTSDDSFDMKKSQ